MRLIAVIFLVLFKDHTCDGASDCYFPSAFRNSEWLDSSKGDVIFNNATIEGYTLNRLGTSISSWECVNIDYFDAEGILIFRSTTPLYVVFNQAFYAYFCLKMTKLTEHSFQYYYQHPIQPLVNNDRVFAHTDNTLTSKDIICDNQDASPMEAFNIMLQRGNEGEANLICPSQLLGVFDFTYTAASTGILDCEGTEDTWNVCTDRTSMFFSNSDVEECRAKMPFAASDNSSTICMGHVETDDFTYVMLYNDDPMVDGSMSFAFTCLAVNEAGTEASLAPNSCREGQTANTYPTDIETGGDIGALINISARSLCPLLEDSSTVHFQTTESMASTSTKDITLSTHASFDVTTTASSPYTSSLKPEPANTSVLEITTSSHRSRSTTTMLDETTPTGTPMLPTLLSATTMSEMSKKITTSSPQPNYSTFQTTTMKEQTTFTSRLKELTSTTTSSLFHQSTDSATTLVPTSSLQPLDSTATIVGQITSDITYSKQPNSSINTLLRPSISVSTQPLQSTNIYTTPLVQPTLVWTPSFQSTDLNTTMLEKSILVSTPSFQSNDFNATLLEKSILGPTPSFQSTDLNTTLFEQSTLVSTPQFQSTDLNTTLHEKSLMVSTPPFQSTDLYTTLLEQSTLVSTPPFQPIDVNTTSFEQSTLVSTQPFQSTDLNTTLLEQSTLVSIPSFQPIDVNTTSFEQSMLVSTPTFQSTDLNSTLFIQSMLVSTPTFQSTALNTTLHEKSLMVSTPPFQSTDLNTTLLEQSTLVSTPTPSFQPIHLNTTLFEQSTLVSTLPFQSTDLNTTLLEQSTLISTPPFQPMDVNTTSFEQSTLVSTQPFQSTDLNITLHENSLLVSTPSFQPIHLNTTLFEQSTLVSTPQFQSTELKNTLLEQSTLVLTPPFKSLELNTTPFEQSTLVSSPLFQSTEINTTLLEQSTLASTPPLQSTDINTTLHETSLLVSTPSLQSTDLNTTLIEQSALVSTPFLQTSATIFSNHSISHPSTLSTKQYMESTSPVPLEQSHSIITSSIHSTVTNAKSTLVTQVSDPASNLSPDSSTLVMTPAIQSVNSTIGIANSASVLLPSTAIQTDDTTSVLMAQSTIHTPQVLTTLSSAVSSEVDASQTPSLHLTHPVSTTTINIMNTSNYIPVESTIPLCVDVSESLSLDTTSTLVNVSMTGATRITETTSSTRTSLQNMSILQADPSSTVASITCLSAITPSSTQHHEFLNSSMTVNRNGTNNDSNSSKTDGPEQLAMEEHTDTGLIVGAVIGSALFVAAAVAGFVVCYRMKLKQIRPSTHLQGSSSNIHGEVARLERQPAQRSIEYKKVTKIYEEENGVEPYAISNFDVIKLRPTLDYNQVPPIYKSNIYEADTSSIDNFDEIRKIATPVPITSTSSPMFEYKSAPKIYLDFDTISRSRPESKMSSRTVTDIHLDISSRKSTCNSRSELYHDNIETSI